jgi:hypothetical protein
VISHDFLGRSPPHCGKILYITNKKTSELSPPPPAFGFFLFLAFVPTAAGIPTTVWIV